MKTLSAQAEANRFLDSVQMLWLLECEFDQYGLVTQTKRYATEDFTLSGNGYDGLFSERGFDLGWSRLRAMGGLAARGGFSISIRDEEDESVINDTYVLANDTGVVYGIFIDGTEVTGDRIEFIRGVVERNRTGRNVWSLQFKDDSRKKLRPFPSLTIDPNTYPYAYNYGITMPQAWGNLNLPPDNFSGESTLIAPCRSLNRWDLTFTSSLRKKTGSAAYQWYPNANRWATISNTSETDNVITCDDASRAMILRPNRPHTANDRPTWYLAADDDTSTDVTVTNGQHLDVWLGGAPALGTITAINVFILASGTYDWAVYDDAVLKDSGLAQVGDHSVALVVPDFETWRNLALINVRIEGANSVDVEEIYVSLEFEDDLSIQDEPPIICQSVVGYEDQAANYEDGGVISGAGTALRNPVYQLEAILRDVDLISLTEAEIGAGAVAAAASRTYWKFDWWQTDEEGEGFIDDFATEAGLDVYPEGDTFNIVARDRTRAAQHFFHGDYHMPVSNPNAPASQWGYQLNIEPADASKILNEFNIRFMTHPGTGEPQESIIASGQYRMDGTCTVSSSTSRLTDALATFVTLKVKAGERIYVAGDQDYEVTADATVETWVAITPVTAGAAISDITSATDYRLGPSLDGDCFLSQRAFKTVNALGSRQRRAGDDAGYKCRFINDADTALLFQEYNIEWYSQPRDRLTFPLFHSAVDVQKGDVIMLQHDNLRPSKQAEARSVLAGNILAGTTVWDVLAGTAGAFQADDIIFLKDDDAAAPDVSKVVSVDHPNDQITVARGQLNNEAAAHSSGLIIWHVTVKWLVTGIKPPTPEDPHVQVEAWQMPKDYFRIGRVSATGYPDYATATAEERLLSGWATLLNGRVVDEEVDSDISYVGPDTGQYGPF